MSNEKQQEGVTDELQKRIGSFLEEYKKLVDKHSIDLASYPVWVPDGQGGFKCTIQSTPVDITNQSQKSPFVAEEKE
jgi:hypothetical protein